MTSEIRVVRESEFPDYVKAMFWAAGRPVDEAFVRERRRCTDIAKALAVFDDGQLVGTIGMRDLTMQLPGGTAVPVLAIGQGGVLPGHTGQGYMRQMMTHALAAARKDGIAICAWTTSEWPLYERYGGGPATYASTYEIETSRAAFRPDQTVEGRCKLVSSDEALQLLPALHATSARQGYTLVARDTEYWSVVVERLDRGDSLDFLDVGGGHPPAFFCLYRNGAGTAEGVAIYRILPVWKRGLSRTVLDLLYFVHVSAESLTGLYRHLLTLASIDTVRIHHRPVDDPLKWMLVDGRRVETVATGDHIWLRIVDIPAALRQRGSGMLTRPMTLCIRDRHFGESEILQLTPVDGKLLVESSLLEAEIETDVSAISSLFLGGTPIRPFVDTGRVRYRSEESLLEFISLFAARMQPFIDSDF